MPSDFDQLRPVGKHEGLVYYGCRPWEPRYDLSMGTQRKSGLYRTMHGKKKRDQPCLCGSGALARVQVGTRWYCEGCTRYGMDHLELGGVVTEPPPDAQDSQGRTGAAVGRSALKGGRGA